MALEEALQLIPTHIYLKPGKDRWQKGDEIVVIGMSIVGLLSKVHSQEWEPCDERDIGRLLLEKQIGRRAIPESVRKSMAEGVIHTSTIPKNEDVGWFQFESWLLSAQEELK